MRTQWLGLVVRWRAVAVIAIAVSGLGGCAALDASRADAALPNQVEISSRLMTAGQPARAQLLRLRDRGFEVVLHIAARQARNVIDDEPALVMAQSLYYVRVDVDADHLSDIDARAVAAVLDRFAECKVLIHCEFNWLASSLVFLYRAVERNDDPRRALDALERAWVPRGNPRMYIESRLRERGIALDTL